MKVHNTHTFGMLLSKLSKKLLLPKNSNDINLLRSTRGEFDQLYRRNYDDQFFAVMSSSIVFLTSNNIAPA